MSPSNSPEKRPSKGEENFNPSDKNFCKSNFPVNPSVESNNNQTYLNYQDKSNNNLNSLKLPLHHEDINDHSGSESEEIDLTSTSTQMVAPKVLDYSTNNSNSQGNK